jgi:hypothetical protein
MSRSQWRASLLAELVFLFVNLLGIILCTAFQVGVRPDESRCFDIAGRCFETPS